MESHRPPSHHARLCLRRPDPAVPQEHLPAASSQPCARARTHPVTVSPHDTTLDDPRPPDNPGSDGPDHDHPAAHDPAADNRAAHDRAAHDPAADNPAAHDPAADNPAAHDRAAHDPAAGGEQHLAQLGT
jgi:hypothetical protein